MIESEKLKYILFTLMILKNRINHGLMEDYGGNSLAYLEKSIVYMEDHLDIV